ncbi:hypothetical protein BaRGS_00004731 [Batillaria attramentaria]|uniref:PLAT domain-containing protein n=1 Tax=Batillaria attramentaria TaxID=370345 RepID=A0ABD0LWM1_9CAEN
MFSLVFLTLCAVGHARHTVRFQADGGCEGVHYEPLGCFSQGYPFNNTREPPQNPDFISTSFHLFTRRNRHNGQVLSTRYRGVSVRGSLLDARRPVKIIIHGFLQNYRSPWIVELTQALLQRDDVNVISVNWAAGSGFPYTQAAANTRVVGAEVARLITLLGQRKAISARNVHIIGHSLGAHVAGEAGRQLQDTLGRISGLDPADPNFSFQPTEVRLDPSYGTLQPMGHVDFYPNGGLDQPGCHSDASVFSFVQDAYHEGMTIRLYIESVTSSCPFTAYPCDSAEDFNAGRCLRCGNRPCPSMGYEADMYKRSGTYYLNTTSGLSSGSNTPFCGYHYMVHVTLGDDMSSTHGVLHVHIVGDNGETPSLELYRSVI